MPYSSETQFIDANNIDVLYTLSEMQTMARSKTWTVLDVNKDQNKCLEGHDMMDNSSVVSDWKENFRLSQPTPPLAIFSKDFVSRCRGNKLLVNHSIVNVPGVIVVCKRLGIRISFQCKLLLIRIL